jgi:hypothetical protein
MGRPTALGEIAHAVVERRSVIEEIRRAQRPILAIAGSEDHAYPVELQLPTAVVSS